MNRFKPSAMLVPGAFAHSFIITDPACGEGKTLRAISHAPPREMRRRMALVDIENEGVVRVATATAARAKR